MPTFMDSAMRGYGFADDIISRRKEREDRLEQRKFRNSMLERQDSRSQQRLEMEQQQVKQQQARDALEGLLMADEPDPELVKHFEQTIGESPFSYIMPKHRRSLETLEGVTQNPRKINTPEGIEAFNTVYGPQLNKNLGGPGAQGGKIKGKRAAQILPGQKPGTFTVDLAVDFEHDDGRAGQYPAPATVGRGTEPDAEVLQVDAEKAAQSLAGKKGISDILNQPQNREKLMQWYVALGGDPKALQGERNEPFAVSGDVLYNKETGEYERIPDEGGGDAPYRVSGNVMYNRETGEYEQLPEGAGGSDAPADQQLAQFLMDKGIASDWKDAWNKVRQARFSPQKFISDHVSDTLQAQRDAFVEPGDPNYRTPDEIAAEAQEILRSVDMQQGQGGSNEEDPLGIRY